MGIQIAMSLPAGSIAPYAGALAPGGWLFMAGQAVSRATNAALFLAIGTTYGSGDGSTTFNLPDARGRALFGRDNMGGSAANRATTGGSGLNGAALGAVGGGENITLSAAQMPSHFHSDYRANGNDPWNDQPIDYPLYKSGGQAMTQNTNNAGGSGSHNNMPPALIINYIIKT